MTNWEKIQILQARIRILESRGPHNRNICNKLRRKINQLQQEAWWFMGICIGIILILLVLGIFLLDDSPTQTTEDYWYLNRKD